MTTDHESTEPDATRESPRVGSWVVLSRGRDARDPEHQPVRRTMAIVAALAVLVLVISVVVGVVAARRLAEHEAVNDAAKTADLVAEAIVQPALTDAAAHGDPAATAKVADALHEYLGASSLVRVKLWSRDGTIVWSDEPRLIGRNFARGGDVEHVFAHPRTVAKVSNLDEPENEFERGQGKLLEAYRPVWTPNGTPMLFETYSPYTEVDTRAGQLWRGFAGVTISSLLLFAALLLPLIWGLVVRLRRAQRQREELLERAVHASYEERRRIAGTLHDGVVQELAATSFAVSGAVGRAAVAGQHRMAEELGAIAGTLRRAIGGLRTLLVDIYPETLETAGLVEVLRDLAGTLRSREIEVHLDLPQQDPGLGPDDDRLVFRIAHECLQNVQQHAAASNVWIRLTAEGVLEIADDGIGFVPAAVLEHPQEGHFGLRVLADLAGEAGAELAVSAAPGVGTRWRLVLARARSSGSTA